MAQSLSDEDLEMIMTILSSYQHNTKYRELTARLQKMVNNKQKYAARVALAGRTQRPETPNVREG